jgi:DNA-binding HxlR family transcriptional regulator
MYREKRRSGCPIACFLDILGDRWTMLIIRDLLLGARKYKDFLASPERITTNILAERLKRLEAEGLVRKEAYQDHPVRHTYALTRKGLDLGPLMQEMIAWAQKYKKEVLRSAPQSSENTIRDGSDPENPDRKKPRKPKTRP